LYTPIEKASDAESALFLAAALPLVTAPIS
jgi:hypothetical protein